MRNQPQLFYQPEKSTVLKQRDVPLSFVHDFKLFLGGSVVLDIRLDRDILRTARSAAKTEKTKNIWRRLLELTKKHGRIKVWLED